MNSISALLMGLAGPIAKQVLLSLGFSVVTYVGVDSTVEFLLGQARTVWAGGMAGDVGQYVALSGVNTGLSMLAGAISGRVALFATKSLRLL